MTKRRTKKQKAKTAEKRIVSNWSSGSVTFNFDPNVNSQINPEKVSLGGKIQESRSPQISAQTLDLVTIRKNIYKSLILSCLILGMEVVIYFIWK
jgi:hypothetical protein